MSSQDRQTYDDRLLTQYILGALPKDEAERLDELCIADEEVATRLHAIENDLVDAYVRGEMSGEDLEHFRSFYLSSATRRRKVGFASALLEYESKPVTTPAPILRPATQEAAVQVPEPEKKPAPLGRPATSRWPRWGFAFAAALMLFAAAYLLVENLRLRRQMNDAQAQHAAADQREQELEKELSDQRAANVESAKEIERLRQSQANPEQLKTVALLLPPPTRGAGRLPAISVPLGTDLAVLLLALESDDFPEYRAALKDPGTGQILWDIRSLQASPLGARKVVSVSFPASLLKQQNYIVELTGEPARGAAESIGNYPFRAVLK